MSIVEYLCYMHPLNFTNPVLSSLKDPANDEHDRKIFRETVWNEIYLYEDQIWSDENNIKAFFYTEPNFIELGGYFFECIYDRKKRTIQTTFCTRYNIKRYQLNEDCEITALRAHEDKEAGHGAKDRDPGDPGKVDIKR